MVSKLEFGDGSDTLIVIPSLNESAHVESVIRTLQSDSAIARALIVVADGGSRDDTCDIVERMGQSDPRVMVLRTDRPLGISASVNKAVKQHGSGRQWLIRIDAHAKYPPNYASRLIGKALEKDAAAVVTPMITEGKSCFQRAAAAAQNSLLGTGGAAHRLADRGGWVEHGHHALIRLNYFTAIGGYDETFSHNEDAELDRRLANAGGRIWLADDLALVYFPRGSTKSLFRQYFFYGRGRAMTIARHGGKRRMRQLLPLLVVPMVAALVASGLHWFLALPALAWLSICMLYGLLLGLRSGDACAAISGYPAMVMHFAWSLGYWKQLVAGPQPGMPPGPLSVEPRQFAAVRD